MRAPLCCRAALVFAFPVIAGAARAQQPGATPPGAAGSARRQGSPLQHAQHRSVACSSCHTSTRRHGEVIIRSPSDCMRCHHGGAGRENCSRCHDLAAMRRLPVRPRTFSLAASRSAVTISMRFDHQPHAGVACAQCHADQPSRAPDQANCASCHAPHHGPSATCTTCHSGADLMTKHSRNDHVHCATAACHGQAAADLPASREACLVCHTIQRSHVPGRVCTNCHPLRGTS